MKKFLSFFVLVGCFFLIGCASEKPNLDFSEAGVTESLVKVVATDKVMKDVSLVDETTKVVKPVEVIEAVEVSFLQKIFKLEDVEKIYLYSFFDSSIATIEEEYSECLEIEFLFATIYDMLDGEYNYDPRSNYSISDFYTDDLLNFFVNVDFYLKNGEVVRFFGYSNGMFWINTNGEESLYVISGVDSAYLNNLKYNVRNKIHNYLYPNPLF